MTSKCFQSLFRDEHHSRVRMSKDIPGRAFVFDYVIVIDLHFRPDEHPRAVGHPWSGRGEEKQGWTHTPPVRCRQGDHQKLSVVN